MILPNEKHRPRTDAIPDRPIFILGPHRSGTTLLYEILARHIDLAHLNKTNHHLPDTVRLAWMVTRLGGPGFPHEGQGFWDRFRDRDDDLMEAAQATDKIAGWYRERILRVVSTRNSPRFLAKYPRLSLRLGWLDRVFPDAIYVHILRDWRAVVASTLLRKRRRARRGGEWFGVRTPGWRRMRSLPHEVAATIQYAVVTRYLERVGPAHGDRYVQVRYEDLCRAPRETARYLAQRCSLAFTREFETSIPKTLRSANDNWPTVLAPEVVSRLRDLAPAFLDAHREPEREAELIAS